MKLIIQIPCFNEEKTLDNVIRGLPKKINGIKNIETLIINDGSQDKTQEVAIKSGVDYILRNPRNMGLSVSFQNGIETCLYLGADIIVNTDGDNQYKGNDINKLVDSIVNKDADMVIGCRNFDNHPEFSKIKIIFQKLGSKLVNVISGIKIPDVTSGFRAYSKLTAQKIIIFNKFSYTVESLIQSGSQGSKILYVPIIVNKKTRNSRLFKSNLQYIFQQSLVIIKTFIFYKPLPFFFTLAFSFLFIAIIFGLRFFYYLSYVEESKQVFKMGSGILLQFSIVISFLSFLGGFLCMVLSGTRSLIENIRLSLNIFFSNSDSNNQNIEQNLWRKQKINDKI